MKKSYWLTKMVNIEGENTIMANGAQIVEEEAVHGSYSDVLSGDMNENGEVVLLTYTDEKTEAKLLEAGLVNLGAKSSISKKVTKELSILKSSFN